MMHFMGLVSSSAQPYPLAEGQSVININACSHVLTALKGGEEQSGTYFHTVFTLFTDLFQAIYVL